MRSVELQQIAQISAFSYRKWHKNSTKKSRLVQINASTVPLDPWKHGNPIFHRWDTLEVTLLYSNSLIKKAYQFLSSCEYCQAQLQLQFQLSWKLRLPYSHLIQQPTHPHPTGKAYFQNFSAPTSTTTSIWVEISFNFVLSNHQPPTPHHPHGMNR